MITMRFCDKCGITVNAPRAHCPLCQCTMRRDENPKSIEEEIYPEIKTYYKQYFMFFRILIFVSIVLGGASLAVSIFAQIPLWISLVIIAGIVYMWLTVITAVKKWNNVSKNILYQSFFLGFVVVLIDHYFGWLKWSVNYVIPSICLSSMVAIAIICKIRRYRINEYAVYMLVNCFFAVAPLVLWLTGVVTVVWPSVFSIIFSVLILAGFWLLTGLNIKGELRRRFHI